MKRLGDLFNKINSIELLVHKSTEMLKETLTISKQHQFLIANGINGYKQKIIRDFKIKEKSTPKEALYQKIRHDMSLRHPHRKILHFLIKQFDYQAGVFREAFFSQIVKECRLGKNKAGEYLDFLVARGYLRKREDGYRVWYSVKLIQNA